MMDELDPRHGTYAGVQAHQRTATPLCEPCITARRRYQKGLEVDHARGRHRRIPPDVATRHAHRLLALGVTVQWIADEAGVARATIFRLTGTGCFDIPPVIEARTVAAVLAVQPPDVPRRQGYLPRLGAIRRIEALAAIGWSRTEVARRLNTTTQTLTTMISGNRGVDVRPNQWVQAATWHRINDLYAELHMTPGPSAQSRRRAQERGSAPPLAWDDIDDPNEQPCGWHYIPEDRAGAIRAMLERGDNRTQVERALGLNTSALMRWCHNNGLRDEYLTLAAREGDWNARGRYSRNYDKGAA